MLGSIIKWVGTVILGSIIKWGGTVIPIASASSGQMLSHFGWASVALTVMPIAAVMLAVIVLRARSAVKA